MHQLNLSETKDSNSAYCKQESIEEEIRKIVDIITSDK